MGKMKKEIKLTAESDFREIEELIKSSTDVIFSPEQLLKFADKWNWNILSAYCKFTVEDITVLEKYIKFNRLFKHPDIVPFDSNIAYMYRDLIDWNFISKFYHITDYSTVEKFIDYLVPCDEFITNIFKYADVKTVELVMENKPFDMWYNYVDRAVFDTAFFMKHREFIPWKTPEKIDWDYRFNAMFARKFSEHIDWNWLYWHKRELLTDDIIEEFAYSILMHSPTFINRTRDSIINVISDDVIFENYTSIDSCEVLKYILSKKGLDNELMACIIEYYCNEVVYKKESPYDSNDKIAIYSRMDKMFSYVLTYADFTSTAALDTIIKILDCFDDDALKCFTHVSSYNFGTMNGSNFRKDEITRTDIRDGINTIFEKTMIASAVER